MIVECPSCGQRNRVPAARSADRARCGKCREAIAPVSTAVPIESAADFDEALRGERPVLVDFWAAWCGPCRMVAPEVEKLARAHAGEIVVAKVDTEALPDVAARYAIRGIPTLILFRNGREARRVSGAMSAPQIESALLR